MTKRDLELHEPIKRGDDEITGFDIRRPKAGELRGVTVTDIIRMDVVAISTVLPRITVPPITPNEAAALDPFDFGEAAMLVSDFFTEPPKKKEKKGEEPPQIISSTEPQTSPSSSDGNQETSGNSNSKSSSNGGDAPAKS